MLLTILYLVLLMFNGVSFLTDSTRYINYRALLTLLILLYASRGLEISGFLNAIAIRIISRWGIAYRTIIIVLVTELFASMIIMNDAVLFIYIPLILSISRISKYDKALLVVLAVSAANIGSSLTPFGNPQNLIIWIHYRLGIDAFIKGMLLYFLISAGILIAYTVFILKRSGCRKIIKPALPRIRINIFLASFSFLVFILVVLGNYIRMLLLVALIFSVLGYILIDKNILLRTDYVLLLIFMLMFIDFGYLGSQLRIPAYLSKCQLVAVSVVVSFIISNVPATIFFLKSVSNWLPLAIGVNLGGLGVLTGSLANIIGVRLSGIGIRDFHRYSIPLFISVFVIVIALCPLFFN